MTDPRSQIPTPILFNAVEWNDEQAEKTAKHMAHLKKRGKMPEMNEALRDLERYEHNAEELRAYIWRREANDPAVQPHISRGE